MSHTIQYLHALMPQEVARFIELSHELPPAELKADHEVKEFIGLALELGAIGFYREDVQL